ADDDLFIILLQNLHKNIDFAIDSLIKMLHHKKTQLHYHQLQLSAVKITHDQYLYQKMITHEHQRPHRKMITHEHQRPHQKMITHEHQRPHRKMIIHEHQYFRKMMITHEHQHFHWKMMIMNITIWISNIITKMIIGAFSIILIMKKMMIW